MGRKAKLGAGYRQRNDGRIEYRWRGADGKTHSVCGHSVEECRVKADKKRQTCYIKNADVTLDRYYLEFERGREGTVKESTAMQTGAVYKRISKAIGGMKVREIERRQVQKLQDDFKAVYTTSTVNDTISLLSCIMKQAVNDGIINRNPCAGIRRLKRTEPPARETIHRALTIDETERFFAAARARNSFYYGLFAFLLNTGCRIGEAGALTRADIDYNAGVIHIRRTVTRSGGGEIIGDSPKTKTSKRDIPITAATREILQRQELQNRDVFGDIPDIGKPIFRTLNGEILLPASIKRELFAAQKAAGIERFTVHAFRDTFATRALESGMKPQTLKEILGHSSFAMTMDLYAHTMEETKRAEMDLLHTGIMP